PGALLISPAINACVSTSGPDVSSCHDCHHYFYVFDKKSSSCMIDFVDRFDRFFSFYPVFCIALE
ncbi:hypothetical protein ACVSG8_005649, partial [Escherichia coli]